MSPTHPFRRLCAIALGASLLVASIGCGGPDAASAASVAGLPLWEGRAQEVFDDNIDPAAVGLSMEGPSARSDSFLRERAQTADVVARLRVQTVTAESIGDDTSYHLVVQVGVPQLREPRTGDLSFELSIRPSSRGYAVARAFDTRLRGLTFIGFVSRFVGLDGEPAVHFHLAADTADVAAAVKEAVALGEITGS